MTLKIHIFEERPEIACCISPPSFFFYRNWIKKNKWNLHCIFLWIIIFLPSSHILSLSLSLCVYIYIYIYFLLCAYLSFSSLPLADKMVSWRGSLSLVLVLGSCLVQAINGEGELTRGSFPKGFVFGTASSAYQVPF